MWRLYFGLVTLVTTTLLWSTVKGENIFEFRGVFITFRGQIMAEFGAGKLKIIGL